MLPKLTAELLDRGYTHDEIGKILGLNVLRVLRAAEATSTSLKLASHASEKTVEEMDRGFSLALQPPGLKRPRPPENDDEGALGALVYSRPK